MSTHNTVSSFPQTWKCKSDWRLSFSLLTQASKTSQTEALVSHCQLYFVPALGNPPRQWDSTQLKRQLWISLQQPRLERPAKVIRLCMVCFHELPQTMTPHLFAGHQRPKMWFHQTCPNAGPLEATPEALWAPSAISRQTIHRVSVMYLFMP